MRTRIAKGDPDFTAYYTAGRVLREGLGSRLYDAKIQESVQREFTSDADIRSGPLSYIHPPFEALLFLPLTFLPYTAAFTLWNTINLGLLCAICMLLRQSVGLLRHLALWKLVLIALAFFPIFANFHQGQDAIALLFLVLLGFRALENGEEFTAGLWLGLAVFKYQLIFPLFLVMALWKGRRFAAGFATTASGAAAISVAIVGWHGALEYPPYAWRVVSGPGFGGAPYRQLLSLQGLVAGWPCVDKVGWPVEMAVSVATLALLVVVVRCPGATKSQTTFRLCASCAVIAVLLCGFSTSSYDLSLLVLPLAFVAEHSFSDSTEKTPAAALFVPAIPLLISPLWFFLWMRLGRINLMAIFLLWWFFAIRNEIMRSRSGRGGAPIPAALA